MHAVVLSVGTELLRGDIVDTNAAFLGRELTELGIQVQEIGQVGDRTSDLLKWLRHAGESCQLITCTGGLGPTQDDVTREAIAEYCGEPMTLDEGLLADVESKFASLHRRMPARNAKQAMLIPSAQVLNNDHGTAPGWFVEREGMSIIALPGPPSEMEPMWRHQVRPRLEAKLGEQIAAVSLMTFGLGESALEERIADVIDWHEDVTVATYAKRNGVQVHVSARAGTKRKAQSLVQQARERLHQRLGQFIYGEGDESLSAVIGRLLTQRRLTVAVMESATGGELASAITDTEGSSAYFLGGIVAYSADVKAAHGVDRNSMETSGVISGETALSMAEAVRRELGANIGIGTTGVAGPEADNGKPPGTCFVAISIGASTEVREIHRPASRELFKHFASLCALDLLRRHLLSEESA